MQFLLNFFTLYLLPFFFNFQIMKFLNNVLHSLINLNLLLLHDENLFFLLKIQVYILKLHFNHLILLFNFPIYFSFLLLFNELFLNNKLNLILLILIQFIIIIIILNNFHIHLLFIQPFILINQLFKLTFILNHIQHFQSNVFNLIFSHLINHMIILIFIILMSFFILSFQTFICLNLISTIILLILNFISKLLQMFNFTYLLYIYYIYNIFSVNSELSFYSQNSIKLDINISQKRYLWKIEKLKPLILKSLNHQNLHHLKHILILSNQI